ncbi:DUF1636 domain-containing protein [Croceicoccus naphthovorans]|uniref:Metal-binding protein n=1 Tax=Croceicoccus naphthovorans TaxID=1348774 RepID=A0A0G3XEI4_9SPHN|nr:DUF1636 domain-containing protein [Croceicoccus naphthovorans]AKM09980.1 metal-binding protein [Croceicoccus naphthovorans]MBB3991151.1 putative metal-binding protein [Croceicoccus naphthovorans]
MLARTSNGPSVVVCSTCRLSADRRDDDGGQRGGALLAAQLRELQIAESRYARIAIEEMACLFACSRHCTIHVRAPGKIGYVLGDFAPDGESARAILDYALNHDASAEGQVRYADWPEGVKGHFIVRVPPEGGIVT